MRLILIPLLILLLFAPYVLAQTNLHISCDDASRTIDCVASVPADASPYDIETLADHALIKIADHFHARSGRDVTLKLLVFERISNERYDDDLSFDARVRLTAEELDKPLDEFTGMYRFMKNYDSLILWG